MTAVPNWDIVGRSGTDAELAFASRPVTAARSQESMTATPTACTTSV